MDREPAGRSPSAPPTWSVVVVPAHGRGEVHEYSVTHGQLRRLQVAAGALLVAVVVLAAGLGVTLPRSLAYGALLDDNLVLRDRLQAIDHRMSEVDRLLLRLRLYDAQLRGLAPGEGGPAEDEPPSPDPDFVGGDLPRDERPMEVSADEGGLSGPEAWARSVEGRIDLLLQVFPRREADLQQLMGRLEADRAQLAARPARWPARGLLSSGFGWRRDPFTRRHKFHSGLDVAGEKGDPIKASAEGTVVRSEWNSGYGQMIEVDHGFGITTLYGHCSKLLVKAGDRVAPGDVIGRMGSTGRSTGNHLHFEVRLDGEAVDPLPYLRGR